MAQHRSPAFTATAHRAGPLATLHTRQRRWPVLVRVLWWAFVLPLAIAAWAACLRHVAARVAGYALAGIVLLFGVASCSADPSTPVADSVPSSVASPVAAAPLVAPAPVLPAPVLSPPLLPAVAPPSPSLARSAPPAARTVAPAPVAPRHAVADSSSTAVSGLGSASGYGGTYTNSSGNQVERPDGDSAGASARCKDGTFSHSQHRSGTCSGHGGIAR